MAASGTLYDHAISNALAGAINYTSDSIKMALLTGYTPNVDTDQHWSDVSAKEIAGTGYTAGGAALGSKSTTVTPANSWGTSRAATTAYVVGNVVRPASGNGYLYQCSTAGTTGSGLPTYPTVVGQTVTDGTAVWTCVGRAIIVFSGATVQWTASTISAAQAVIYDAQSGTPSTEPLIATADFGGTVTDTAGTFQVPPDAILGFFYFFTQ